jgi:hypothetical protein
VVSVSSTSALLLADARASLQRTLKHRPQTDLAIVFSYWILMRPAEAAEAANSVVDAMQRSGAQQDFQTIATLGFAADSGLFDVSKSATLKQGLNRLAGRQPFIDEVPMPFCSDAIGILGVALGTKFLADTSASAKIVKWLSSFLKNIYLLDGTENWQRCFFQAADLLLGGSIGLPNPVPDQAADVCLALRAKGIFCPRMEKRRSGKRKTP